MDFPSHNIDPRKKNKDWHLNFVKAIWADVDGQPKKMFYHYAAKYDEIKTYALGRQDSTKYKGAMHINEQANETFAVLDFRIVPLVKTRRQIGLGRLQKAEYNIVATPIDPAAKDEADGILADLQAKMMLRAELKKANPHLADAPQLRATAGEPLDEDELEMVKQFGFKLTYAKEAEQGIQLIFSQNNFSEMRHKMKENIFDDGVVVVKDWMEENGRIKLRVCDNRSVITNYCRYPDFSDLWYCGEVVDVPWSTFREAATGKFTEEEFELIFNKAKNANGWDTATRPTNRQSQKNKVKVLDVEWLSDDEILYVDKKDGTGNPVFKKSQAKDYTAPKGSESYKKVKRQYLYRAKWIVGTDYVYDWGRAPFQKRDKGLAAAKMSYHIKATNFHNMQASGVMEDVMPIADQMAISWLKLQNIRNELMPYFIEIDLSALEGVEYAKGNQTMTPKDLIQMMFQNGILLSRRSEMMGSNPNYKAIEYVQTNYGEAIAEAWNDYNQHKQLLNDATGFNEVTDGSAPNPKNLNSTNAAANESTNNALYHIQHAEREMILELSYSVLTRLKRAVKMGKVEGYVTALGTGTMKMISVSPEIDDHDYGLLLEDKPTPEQKQFLQTLMAKGMQEGTLDATDIITVENCVNLKQAEQILAIRIKKRKEEAQQQALQQTQANAQTQIQSAQAAEQMKQQTIQVQMQADLAVMNAGKEWDYKIKELELGVKHTMNKDSISSKENIAGVNPSGAETPLPAEQAAA